MMIPSFSTGADEGSYCKAQFSLVGLSFPTLSCYAALLVGMRVRSVYFFVGALFFLTCTVHPRAAGRDLNVGEIFDVAVWETSVALHVQMPSM